MVMTEMGLDFELERVDRKTNEQKSADYLLLNPTGRIPTLIDDGLAIFESAAICLYLCDKHPQSALAPTKTSADKAEFYQWLFYLTATIQPELMVYFYPQKHVLNGDTASIVEAQEKRVTEMFALIDKALEGKLYLVGSSITVCDFFLFMLSHWASGFSQPPLSFSNLKTHLQNMAKRDAVIAVCEFEGTNLEMYR